MGKSHPREVKERVLAGALADEDWRAIAEHNGVAQSTANKWVLDARRTGEYEAGPSRRGGAHNVKVKWEHIEFLLDKLGENCQLTLSEMKDMLHDEFGITVHLDTVRRALDGACYTVKKIHRDVDYRNNSENKVKRKAFAIKLLQYISEQKVICYLDETNFNIWCSRNYGWSEEGTHATVVDAASKGKNIHVIARISRSGLEYFEARFGYFNNDACNDYVRRLLRNLSGRYALSNVVLIVDNAPCHSRVDDVFGEPEFEEATLHRLAPYSPMLNGIENVFSVFKSHVKRFMAVNRPYIVQTPPRTTQAEYRSGFLRRAAEDILPSVASPELCSACIHHTIGFVSSAILMKDMEVDM